MDNFGFGKNSGPNAGPRAQTPSVRFPSPSNSAVPSSNRSHVTPQRTPSPPLDFQNNRFPGGPNPRGGIQQRRAPSPVWSGPSNSANHSVSPPPQLGFAAVARVDGKFQSRPKYQTNQRDVPLQKRTRSPSFSSSIGASPENSSSAPYGRTRSPVDYSDLDAPETMPSPPLAFESSFLSRDSTRRFAGSERHSSSSVVWGNQSNPPESNDASPIHEMSSSMTTGGPYQSVKNLQSRPSDEPLQKRTRSPTIPSVSGASMLSPLFASNGLKRAPDSQSHVQSLKPRETKSIEVSVEKPMHLPAVKRTKQPHMASPELNFQENLEAEEEVERELNAKAKRLARFKNELSHPVQSQVVTKSPKVPAKIPSDNSIMDVAGDVTADYEGVVSSSTIVGFCQDMCPESERAERERKGDLDQYERLGGDRNSTNEFLAVKKYTRTAERDAELIRPMPILQKTMEYLLNLLDQPYNDRFLGLYNFLWDRMRAIRMDLRMQHIFDLEAICMLEQMIRLHIIAMHELCEYNKGEGFSEGFDAHLNIEQMNKTSVELFQLYDDHRKKGIHVPSEREFRGYYALLKLDKHPGYRVEPAELSLDLAKMNPELRQTPEILFARDVARACRTGNFIAFFRLARKASYLQACLMHAHFSKLRIQALASLHSGLQINQGIPVTHVAKWLGMEEENIGDLLEYYGFSVKDFEEPYMVKENAYINVDDDFPVKRSKLVESKRSDMIVGDVSLPALSELHATNEVKEVHLKKDLELIPEPQLFLSANDISAPDEEMHDSVTVLSPRIGTPKLVGEPSIDLLWTNEKVSKPQIEITPASPLRWEFNVSSTEHPQNRIRYSQSPKYDPSFRNSIGRMVKHDLEATVPITPDSAEEIRSPALPCESAAHTTSPMTQPVFSYDLEDQERRGDMDEDVPEAATTSKYDEEVAEAKIRLILRLWKRYTARKKKLREEKLLAANAALSSLSLGPPIWRYEAQSGSYSMLDIDHVMSERREIEESSWLVLNPSDVVAPKLVAKNPNAKCLCWKMVLCSSEECIGTAIYDEISPSAPNVWLHSKLMPTNRDGDSDLLVSSPGLAMWRTWIRNQSGVDLTCLSVISSTIYEDLNKAVTGASAVLFLLSENIPLDLQKNRLHEIVMSLPCGSSLPLLIFSCSSQDEADPSTIAKDMGLHDIDKSRITLFSIVFLKDEEMKNSDGFFSNERLIEGLEWLACESPPETVFSKMKTHELVQSHLKSILELPHEMNASKDDVDYCIAAFNEALDRSMKEVAGAAQSNPTGWPCPEIDLLEKSSDEYRATTWYLPSVGWSSPSRTEMLLSALNDLKLPAFKDDLSWLYRGFNICDDIENQKTHLESCIVNYLRETSGMMGMAMAQKEANIMLQKCTRLQLHNTTYYLIPQWLTIFRRIFNWRLAYLNSAEVSSAYVLVESDLCNLRSMVQDDISESKMDIFTPSCVFQPSLDELIEVGRHTYEPRSNHIEHETNQVWSPVASRGAISLSNDIVDSIRNEDERTQKQALTSYTDLIAEVKEYTGGDIMHTRRANKDADKLKELLKKCNIMQDKIDQKLSIYF